MKKEPIEIISHKIQENRRLLNIAVKEGNAIAQSVLTGRISHFEMLLHSHYGKPSSTEGDTKTNEIS